MESYTVEELVKMNNIKLRVTLDDIVKFKKIHSMYMFFKADAAFLYIINGELLFGKLERAFNSSWLKEVEIKR